MLFRPRAGFRGLPRESFEIFQIRNHEQRRNELLRLVHPALMLLGQDLLDELQPRTPLPLHRHLPRLDWPRGYRVFCTWLALSREAHRYQGGPQLNVGVHGDHVAVRLGWDTSAVAFGRFEFLTRHGELGPALESVALESGLVFRVYAARPWPQGSSLAFETATDLKGTFDEVSRRGVWWELGRRHEVPAELERVASPAWGREVAGVFSALLPVYERIACGVRAA